MAQECPGGQGGLWEFAGEGSQRRRQRWWEGGTARLPVGQQELLAQSREGPCVAPGAGPGGLGARARDEGGAEATTGDLGLPSRL